MSRISNGPFLFCEGEPNSLDVMILSRLPKPPEFEIIPAGGKYSIKNFVRGYLQGFANAPTHLIFRDRDFDVEPPETPVLIEPSANSRLFYSYRSSIESYLLDVELIRRYWGEKSQGPKWRHGLAPDEETVRKWILDAAHSIADYQAVRWALTKLKPGESWPRVKNTWTKGSGHLPGSLKGTDCTAEAEKLVRDFHSELEPVTLEKFHKSFASYHARFTAPEFWENHEYLTWFHGKDLKKAMQLIPPYNGLSLDRYCEWAAQQLEVTAFPDLLQLQTKIDQLR